MRFSLKEFRSNLSLRSKMVLGGILILMVPMTVVGSVTFIRSSRTLENVYKKEMLQIAQTLSGVINIALEKDLKILSAVACDPLIIEDSISGQTENTKKKLSILYQLLATDYEGLFLYDADGAITCSGVESSTIGQLVSKTDFFKKAKNGMTCVDSMIFSKTTGNPVFSLSVPIISTEGEFLGGVLGTIKADYLTPYIASIKIGSSGHVLMIDKSGRFIAHPIKEKVLSVNMLEDDELDELAKKMIRQEAGTTEYIFRGDKKVTGFAPIGSAKWSIAMNQDGSEIMALAYANMNFILLFSGISILLIIPLVFYFSKTISSPVQKTLATLNHAVNQATEGIVILDPNGEILFVNPAMAAILERPVREMIGKPFQIDSAKKSVDKEIRNVIENGTVWNTHIPGQKKDGARYTMDLTITPIRNPDNKISGCLVFTRDITQDLLIQERLQQSQKMEAIGTLAGGIAHDFNNILGAVFGYTELARTNIGDRKRLEGNLTHILSAAGRARDLVDRILTFSRKTEVGRKPIVPKYIIKEALKLLRASLPVTIEIREKLYCSAAISGDPTQIHQITMNLCANAGYEMKDSGGVLGVSLDEIVLEAEFTSQHSGIHPGKYLMLEVADSGDGIPDHIRERIFEPFFTTKPAGRGTGLGLSVVHGIVKSLDGAVTVSSEPGKGSIFTIYLPIIEAEVPHVEGSFREQLPEGTERILLVDDEEAIIKSLQALAEDLGYSVSAFTRSVAAWEKFSSNPDGYDIIITDYTMPKMTGIAFAKKIREIRPDIPIIICSGYVVLQEAYDTLESIIFIKKPVTSFELAHTLRNALDNVETVE